MIDRATGPRASSPATAVVDLERLLDALPCLYVAMRPDFTVVAASDAYLQATGTTRAGVLGRGLFEVFPIRQDDPHVATLESLKASLERVIETGTQDAMPVQEYPVLRPDEGDAVPVMRYWSPVNAPVFDEQGHVAFVVHRVEDVTEFVHLTQRGEHLDGLKGHAIVTLDRTGHVVSWNAGAERMLGYSTSDALGLHYARLFPRNEQSPGRPERDLVTAAVDGSVDEAGWRLRKNGTEFWADGVLTALYDEAGHVRGFGSVLRDMTNQRRIESTLQSIVDTATDGIITIDQLGTIRTFNKAATAIFGYELEEITGSNISMLMAEPYQSEHSRYLASYLQTGRAQVMGSVRELSGRRKDGAVFPLELAVSAFHVDGEVGFTGIVRDITDRKRLEAQFQQAQKMEAIGRLAGGVAHDFNNLLTIITGYSDMALSMLPAGEECHDLVEEVSRAGEKAAALTAQLLAFSRKQVVQTRVLDLNAVLLDTERMLRRLIGEDIRLTTRLDPDLCAIQADTGQLSQVVMNLAVNARDAMPEGGVLSIETRNVTAQESDPDAPSGLRPGRYALLSIADTGTGMSPEVMARIFDPFFTTKGQGKGTGLGLSVVHGIVTQGGGHVDVSSQTGHGTTFRIYLPAAQDRTHRPLVDQEAPRQLRGTETVLFVEDDTAVREFATIALRRCGYTVLPAARGQVAMDLLERHGTIDLLATDVVMPGTSGRRLADAVRLVRPEVKVLYLSGYIDDSVIRHGVQQENVALLQKPFNAEGLVRKVREVLDKA